MFPPYLIAAWLDLQTGELEINAVARRTMHLTVVLPSVLGSKRSESDTTRSFEETSGSSIGRSPSFERETNFASVNLGGKQSASSPSRPRRV